MLWRGAFTLIPYIFWLVLICRGTQPKQIFSRTCVTIAAIMLLFDVVVTFAVIRYDSCFKFSPQAMRNSLPIDDWECNMDKFFVAMLAFGNMWVLYGYYLWYGCSRESSIEADFIPTEQEMD